jgi:hypothetical protein
MEGSGKQQQALHVRSVDVENNLQSGAEFESQMSYNEIKNYVH